MGVCMQVNAIEVPPTCLGSMYTSNIGDEVCCVPLAFLLLPDRYSRQYIRYSRQYIRWHDTICMHSVLYLHMFHRFDPNCTETVQGALVTAIGSIGGVVL